MELGQCQASFRWWPYNLLEWRQVVGALLELEQALVWVEVEVVSLVPLWKQN